MQRIPMNPFELVFTSISNSLFIWLIYYPLTFNVQLMFVQMNWSIFISFVSCRITSPLIWNQVNYIKVELVIKSPCWDWQYVLWNIVRFNRRIDWLQIPSYTNSKWSSLPIDFDVKVHEQIVQLNNDQTDKILVRVFVHFHSVFLLNSWSRGWFAVWTFIDNRIVFRSIHHFGLSIVRTWNCNWKLLFVLIDITMDVFFVRVDWKRKIFDLGY